MKWYRSHGVILCLATVLLFACAPTPLVPSGTSRIPVNSEEGISQYRERVKVEQRDRVERTGLARHIDALTKQLHELQAYVTLLQRQQQEWENGSVRQVQQVGAGIPSRHHRASDEVPAKDTPAPGAQALPPIAAVPREIAGPPRTPINEKPTDLCGQKIGTAGPYGWIDSTSDDLSRRTGLGAEHGRCRHISNDSAPSVGG